MKKYERLNTGFTLIELMVVITIIIILSSVSVASYFRFSQREASLNDARNFVSEMKRVQALAKNQVYPEGCSGLTAYNLVSDCSNSEDCKTMTTTALCSSSPTPFFVSKREVLSKFHFTYNISINFEAGTGKINEDGVGVYSLTSSSDPFFVAVKTDENGVISVTEDSSYITPTIIP